jgi:hypothetical protein
MTLCKRPMLAAYATLLSILLLSSTELKAQQEKGDIELQFQGTGTIPVKTPESSSGNLNVKLGKFVTRRQEFGGIIGVNFSGLTTPESTSVIVCPNSNPVCNGRPVGTIFTSTTPASTSLSVNSSGGLFYAYNITSGGKFFPYVSGELFVANFKQASDTSLATPSIGFKSFFKRNAALDLNIGYGFPVNSNSGGVGNGTLQARYGISFIF